MAGTIPRTLGAVPVDNAVEVCADSRALVEISLFVAIDGDLGHTASDHRTGSRRNLVVGANVAAGRPVAVLSGDVEVFLQKLRCRPQGDARRIVQLRPRILLAEDEIGEKDAGYRSVCDAVSGIPRGDEDVLVGTRVLADESHVIDGLHDLA